MIFNRNIFIKAVLGGIVFFVILILGITYQHQQVVKQSKASMLMVGFPKGQMEGLQKELEKVSDQYQHIEAGARFLKSGKMDEAVKEFDIAFSKAKSKGARGEAISYLADAYEKKRDYKKALEYTIIDRDQYVNEWAKAPIVERAKYLEYALQGEHELAVKHAQVATKLDKEVHAQRKESPDYIERLNDIIAAKDYIESLKKKATKNTGSDLETRN